MTRLLQVRFRACDTVLSKCTDYTPTIDVYSPPVLTSLTHKPDKTSLSVTGVLAGNFGNATITKFSCGVNESVSWNLTQTVFTSTTSLTAHIFGLNETAIYEVWCQAAALFLLEGVSHATAG